MDNAINTEKVNVMAKYEKSAARTIIECNAIVLSMFALLLLNYL
jgi:hypothetical protein